MERIRHALTLGNPDRLRAFKKGEVLIREGDAIQRRVALLILTGWVSERVQRRVPEKGWITTISCTPGPGSLTLTQALSEGSIGQRSLITVVAEEDGECVQLDAAGIRGLETFGVILTGELRKQLQQMETLAEVREAAEGAQERINELKFDISHAKDREQSLQTANSQAAHEHQQALLNLRIQHEARIEEIEASHHTATESLRHALDMVQEENLSLDRTLGRKDREIERLNIQLDEKNRALRSAFADVELERDRSRAALGGWWQRFEGFCIALGISKINAKAARQLLGADTFDEPLDEGEIDEALGLDHSAHRADTAGVVLPDEIDVQFDVDLEEDPPTEPKPRLTLEFPLQR